MRCEPARASRWRQRSRASSRLSARDLLRHTGEILKTDAASRSVLMVVNLNRSDRLQALAQQAVSRPVMLDVIKRIQADAAPA